MLFSFPDQWATSPTPPPCLSFQRCRAIPELHSFPTRRSSDLTLERGQLLSDEQYFEAMEEFGDEFEALMGADRKSTRLNSSHVAISYAVFCLKKKMTGGWSSAIHSGPSWLGWGRYAATRVSRP